MVDTPTSEVFVAPKLAMSPAMSPAMNSNVPQLIHKGKNIFTVDDVVGISIDIFAEPTRRIPEGQVLVVKRGTSLSREEWIAWFKLIFHLLVTYLVVTQFLGPISAACVLVGLAIFSPELRQYAEKELFLKSQDVIRYFSKLGVYSFFWLLCTWIAPRYGWLTFFTCTFFSGLLLYFKAETLSDWFAISADKTWRRPSATYPLVVKYDVDELPEMLRLREELLSCDPWRRKMQYISVGAYWVEALCSMALPTDVYNNPNARFLSYIFFSYFLPLIFTVQVVGIIGPRVLRYHLHLLMLVRADVGVRIVRFITAVIEWELPEIVFSLWHLLMTPFAVVYSWTNTLSDWLLPFDEGLVYVKAKLEHLKFVLQPFSALINLVLQLVRGVGMLFGGPVAQVVRFISSWATRLRNVNNAARIVAVNQTLRKMNAIVSPTRSSPSRVVSSPYMRALFQSRSLDEGSPMSAPWGYREPDNRDFSRRRSRSFGGHPSPSKRTKDQEESDRDRHSSENHCYDQEYPTDSKSDFSNNHHQSPDSGDSGHNLPRRRPGTRIRSTSECLDEELRNSIIEWKKFK
eukprot:m.185801 g.185801  ORF g.185801 m.185801 type:complete len:572 (+) comp25571_c0_seq1:652-2367(+)